MKKILLSFLILITLSSFVAATFSCTDYTSKWMLCGALNITGAACDTFWQNASDCNVQVNNSIISNVSINMSGYYNKSEIDGILTNFTQNFFGNLTNSSLNITVNHVYGNATLLNESNGTFMTLDQHEKDMLKLRSDVMAYVNENKNQDNSVGFILLFITMLVILAVMIILLVRKKPREESYPRGKVPEDNYGQYDEEDKEKFKKDKLKTNKRK